MARSGIIKNDFDGLNDFVRALSGKHIVKVGIFGDKNSRDEGIATNAELGATHEFGSFSRGIPARSFLRMPITRKAQEIVKTVGSTAGKLLAQGNMKKVLENLGIAAEAAVGEAFATRGFGQWKPNKPATIRRKGSDAPLIDNGELRRSIASKVEEKR